MHDIFRRIANILQRMINYGHIVKDTPTCEKIHTTLRLTRNLTDKGTVYYRCSRFAGSRPKNIIVR